MKRSGNPVPCSLQENPLFEHCAVHTLAAADEHKSCMHFDAGQLIYQAGTPPFGLYVVGSGKVKVYLEDSEGRELILRIARNGDVIGYRSLLTDSEYVTSAEALEPTTVCRIATSDFEALIDESPEFTRDLLVLTCEELKAVEQRAFSLGYQPARQRVAQALLLLHKTYQNSHVGVEINLRRKDLSFMAGTTRETTIRLLREFADDGYVELSGRTITISDHEGLVKLSMLYD